MPVSREEIYEALFALVSAPAAFVTCSRRLAHWSKVDAQPALFLRAYKEEPLPPKAFGLPQHVAMTAELWIYCQNGDPTSASATAITDLIDVVDQTLAAYDSPDGRQTLGGLVFHCWREGETIVADGAPQTQSVAVLPINLHVADVLVPRPKIFALTATPSAGTLTTGATLSLALSVSVPVTVAGGVPTMQLSSGGTATCESAGGTLLAFSYTVQPSDAAADLTATGITLNGATISDQYGKTLDLTLSPGLPAGPLVVNPPTNGQANR